MLRTLVSRSSCVFAAVFASLSLVGSSLAQSGTTGVQSASPTADQYGVGFDGSSSGCVSPILGVAFNPGENVAPGLEKIDDVDLFTGGFTQNVAGFALPANTPRLVSISYNALSASSLTTSYQGPRWFQNSQPEIIEDESNGPTSTSPTTRSAAAPTTRASTARPVSSKRPQPPDRSSSSSSSPTTLALRPRSSGLR